MTSTVAASVWNSVVYFFTGKHLLEGGLERRGRRYRNWDRSYVVPCPNYLVADGEDALCRAVIAASRVSTVGAGHSFNDLHLGDHLLVSLDKLTGLVQLDVREKTATFRAGTRVREATRILREHGLAFPVLPDHNAQSLGGILATDVHASGSAAYVSQAVTRIRLLDGLGKVHTVYPHEPLFRATIGGMGCTGIVLDVSLKLRESFRLETQSFRCTWSELLSDLNKWREEYDLVAAAYFPALDACIVETKKATTDPLTRRGPRLETTRHVTQAIVQAVMLPWTRRPKGLRRRFSRWLLALSTKHLRLHSRLVLESAEGFNRNVYQIHKEAEFTVPLDKALEVLKAGYELMQENPQQAYYLLGIRVTSTNAHTLVGPGAGSEGQHLAWIAPHLDGNRVDARHDGQWGTLCRAYGGRPHYGKNMLGMDAEYVAKVHGQSWQEFLTVLETHDPHGKFANALTRWRPTKHDDVSPPSDLRCVGERAETLRNESGACSRSSTVRCPS